jgi:flagellin
MTPMLLDGLPVMSRLSHLGLNSMTSINYNVAANTALRTLQQTNSALETSQNRVSTGLKIGEAKDNAAYWSISTTLKSDNKALGTVKDALGLGAATVDTAYQGLNKALEVLDEIKVKLTAATQDGVDKTAVDAEIKQLQQQLLSIATASSFSNENWLQTNSASGYPTDKTVVSSFVRDANGVVSIGTIGFNISESVLFDGATGGLLQKPTAINQAKAAVVLGASGADVGTTAATFTLSVGGVADQTITIDATAAKAIGDGDSIIDNNSELVDVVSRAISANALIKGKVSVSYDATANQLVFTGLGAATVATTTGTGGVVGTAANTTTANASVATISVATATKAVIEAYINIVSKASTAVTTAAAKLGAIASRIELQSTFVDSLVDTIDKGVSNLIDADLSEESTRLQALQTKQQLGIQALSIANASTQNVLSLFRS